MVHDHANITLISKLNRALMNPVFPAPTKEIGGFYIFSLTTFYTLGFFFTVASCYTQGFYIFTVTSYYTLGFFIFIMTSCYTLCLFFHCDVSFHPQTLSTLLSSPVPPGVTTNTDHSQTSTLLDQNVIGRDNSGPTPFLAVPSDIYRDFENLKTATRLDTTGLMRKLLQDYTRSGGREG